MDLTTRLQSALGGGYRLERELGGGGMSRVFVAEDLELGRKVVVKVLPPEMAAGVNAERFGREIKLAAPLQHPHIVPLLHAGRSDDLEVASCLREEGRLAALTGDRAGAIRAYNPYLDLRPNPEPAVQPRVDEVKTELARLVGEERGR